MKTMGELEAENSDGFRNPYQSNEDYYAQRIRDKAKRDKEMLTCPIDTSDTIEEDEEDEEEGEEDEEESWHK